MSEQLFNSLSLLLDKNNLGDFFKQFDSQKQEILHFDTPSYAKLKQDFITGHYGSDFVPRLQTFLSNTFYKLPITSYNLIDLVSVVPTESCNWVQNVKNEYAFYNEKGEKHPFPVLRFNLRNNSSAKIELIGIEQTVESFFSGFHGIPKPIAIESIARYELPLENLAKKLESPLEISPDQMFGFEIEFFEGKQGSKEKYIGQKAIDIEFKFYRGLSLKIPTLYLNCTKRNQGVKLVLLS